MYEFHLNCLEYLVYITLVQAKNLVFIAVKKAFFRARFDITDVSQFSCNVRVFRIDDCVFLIRGHP